MDFSGCQANVATHCNPESAEVRGRGASQFSGRFSGRLDAPGRPFVYCSRYLRHAKIAQSVEQHPRNVQVKSSILFLG